MKGIYSLILNCKDKFKVGNLGEMRFEGNYIYVGSAQGPGGLKRIKRHLKIAEGEKDTRYWHIDYLLGNSEVLGYCYAETRKNKECELANKLSFLETKYDFGCSDCNCNSHLFSIEESDLKNIKKTLEKAFKEIGLDPIFETKNE
ncbi:MAG: Uri superfamily endonuclease [Candidatus Methanohalarchaeum thermophilum]|uniref:Uri superfamily endonuclease n=1 Tax=Methanohalarchaeum thermophilum TaxID=1903181 RepID=A0A1Q6DUN7_METT1|nr:MAG: Uri superfamily endonuclease [Candidatus Methanohalarchaeum thermophilum]